MTPGERRFAQRLEDKLDEDYLCWYDVPVGPQQRHPDFVVLHPSRGFLVLEVKDWKLESLAAIDRDGVTLHTERGRAVVPNPLRQARDYALEVVKLLQLDPALRHAEGHVRAGKLVMPWGWGVVLTNITRAQFDAAELDSFLQSHQVICRDEMQEGADSEQFQQRLWEMFLMPFGCLLTLPQIDRFRWHLFPELRIPSQGMLFDSPPVSTADMTQIPDLIRVMDLQQEQLARSMGSGHRVIHGVAGSGKTMILGYRCIELARQHAKPVLVLCYNKTLAARLEQMVLQHGVGEKVTVAHFHGWCSQQLSAYAVGRPANTGSATEYVDALVQAVVAGVDAGAIPRAQYSAVLIDEGHDFQPDWFRLVVQMVDPETNALLLLYDDAQTIYGSERRRKFSFASVGIQAKGRTTILRLNYRNTLEVLATAKAFAREALSEQSSDEDHIPLVAPESAGRRGPMPELVRCRNLWEEADLIAERVHRALTEGASANDFAVICRSGRVANLIAGKLGNRGITSVIATGDAKRRLFQGEPSVKLLTMHSSKGLEFDTVFVPAVCEIAAHSDAQQTAHEARLLYVAMTRALGRLVMLHHGDGPFSERIAAALREVRMSLDAA